MTNRMQVTIPTPADFSFYQTIHAHGWRHLLPFRWNEESSTLERMERFDNGSVALLTLKASADDHGDVSVECNRDDVPEAEIAGKTRRMLQLDIDITEFLAYCGGRPELAHVGRQRMGRMLCSPTLYEDVCKVILTTNTTWAQTVAMNARIIDAYGSPWPADPTRKAYPAPNQIASVPLDEFAATARLGYRAPAIHALSVDIAEGRVDLHSLLSRECDSDLAWKQLLALRGVGPYAAACLMLYMGRPIKVNADSWARMQLCKELGHTVSDKEVHEFFEPYGNWRGLLYMLYNWRHEQDNSVTAATAS